MADIDPEAVIREHIRHVNGHCVTIGQVSVIGTPEQRASALRAVSKIRCLPYRLAEALATERAKVAELWATWKPYDEDDEGAVPWRLQRDMRAAFADPPTPDPYLRSIDA